MRYLFLVSFLMVAGVNAATYTAASTSQAHVQAAMNLATAPGDTVQIPAGSSSWTSGVTWSNTGGILLGAGSLSTTGGGDVTNITDEFENGTTSAKLFDLTGLSRIAGITFKSGTTAVTDKDSGTIRLGGSTALRIDHCHFNITNDRNYQIIRFGAGLRGVMDHCVIDNKDNIAFYFYNGRSGGGESQGNDEWTRPTGYGTDDFFYLEDNTVSSSGTFLSSRLGDGYTAAKVVMRFNSLVGCALLETHATGHSANDRGTRAQEMYGNSLTRGGATNPCFTMVECANGGAIWWGNASTGASKHLWLYNVTRKNNDTYNQSAAPNGWGYAGTEFNGYTSPNGTMSAPGTNWDGGTFNGTDTLRGYPCIDQPGRGPGDLITGLVPSQVNSAFGTLRWPRQTLEPIYIFANNATVDAGAGGGVTNNNTSGRVVANQDYYLQVGGVQTSATSPFNGTVGTGYGTLANRPTTCTIGVAYWATDQGSWNTSTSNPYGVQQNGADGVLYVATATNTWTLYYTPYTYPHPLQGAGGGSSGSLPFNNGTFNNIQFGN